MTGTALRAGMSAVIVLRKRMSYLVGHIPAAAGLQREPGLPAVGCLNMTVFINAEHDRMPPRADINPDDVLQLGYELGLARQPEPPDPAWLQSGRPPDPLHRPDPDDDGVRHNRPMRGCARRIAEGQGHRVSCRATNSRTSPATAPFHRLVLARPVSP